jgi:heavy metal sensor kinase
VTHLSIRARLSLWYFCFFAVAGILLGLASWLLLRQSLDSLLLHELDERVDDVESFLSAHNPDASTEELRSYLMQEYRSKDEGKWLQLLDESGNWLYASSRGAIANPMEPLPHSPGSPFPFLPDSPHTLRSFSRVAHAGSHTYFIAMAISADSSTVILSKFRRDLWLLVPVVVLSAAIVGHVLSRKALDPVAAIVTEAKRINDQNLGSRLPMVQTRDELSKLSETLNQMLERIEIAFRTVRSLTANASHELRTPLSLIRTRIEIALCFPRTSEQYVAVLQEVQAETIRMTSLVENLLALARNDAGAGQPELRPVELTALLQRCAHEWETTAERSSLELMVTGTGPARWVMGNEESLSRLLRMLVDNACRFTEPGGCIRLSVRGSEGRVTMTVRDNGVGITSQDLPHVFERFYRGQQAPHQERRGSGLGLSLAKWIADQHKALIEVESAPGAGSCFSVVFPEHVPTRPISPETRML